MKDRELLQELQKYAETDYYPFHMPGHKRNLLDFPNPYSIDITEIEGFDNLHCPEGILKDCMDHASRVYQSGETRFLVNGSTCGILSAVCGLTDRGGRILMSRNCHRSSYHGVFLNGLQIEYLYPQIVSKFGIQGGILPEDVDKSLKKYPDIQAILIVSPTYEGIVSDIAEIARIAHGAGVPLIVDEAHGAHFPFARQGGFPVSALELGADVVIQSLHKTLPSFTQTAVIHMRKGFQGTEKIEKYLSVFQTSSPSYLFMASMDRCIRMMDADQGERLKKLADAVREVRRLSETFSCLNILPLDLHGVSGIYDIDPSKLVISLKGTGLSGKWLSDRLRRGYHLEMEMSGLDYVLAMTSPFDREEGFWRLKKALSEIDEEIETMVSRRQQDDRGVEHLQGLRREAPLSIYEAWNAKTEQVALKESEGKVSSEFVYIYPPGIPAIAPGEKITGEIIELIEKYKDQGLAVQGTSDGTAEKILIVRN